jgi:hypothetical protein
MNLVFARPKPLNNAILKVFRLLFCYDWGLPNGVQGKATIQTMFTRHTPFARPGDFVE